MAADAASRAIDQATGRQFGSATQTRTYRPRWHRNGWYVDTEDIMSVTSVANHDSTAITDFILTPRNAVPNGRPYTGIEFHGGTPFAWYGGYPVNHHHSVITVTGEFGWTAVPEAIKLATQIAAGRLYERRNSPGGVLTQRDIDDTSYHWASSAELDADVLATIRPYVRVWAAA